MKKKYPSWTMALCVAALGLLLSMVSAGSWFLYGYERLRFGATFNLGGACYRVPPRWTLAEGQPRQDEVDFRRHFVEGTRFASIRHEPRFKELVADRKPIKELSQRFKLYDISPQNPDNPVRFAALEEAQGLLIIGTSEEAVGELAQQLVRC
jgi:hypothetical protein